MDEDTAQEGPAVGPSPYLNQEWYVGILGPALEPLFDLPQYGPPTPYYIPPNKQGKKVVYFTIIYHGHANVRVVIVNPNSLIHNRVVTFALADGNIAVTDDKIPPHDIAFLNKELDKARVRLS